jgi:hypothetical protein
MISTYVVSRSRSPRMESGQLDVAFRRKQCGLQLQQIETRRYHRISRSQVSRAENCSHAEGNLVTSVPAQRMPNFGYRCWNPNNGGREQLVTNRSNAFLSS